MRATQQQKQFVRITSATNSFVAFTLPETGLFSWQFEFRTTATQLITACSRAGTAEPWRVAWRVGESSTVIRVRNCYLDGNVLFGNVSTRGQLAALVTDGGWHTIRYENHGNTNNDTDPLSPTHQNGTVFHFLNYFSGGINADLRHFKIDMGITGNWTHESELGDTNGFSRQNVEVLSE